MSDRTAAFTIVAGFAAFALVLVAIMRRRPEPEPEISEAALDETLMDSFPASDPPSHGAPRRTGQPAR